MCEILRPNRVQLPNVGQPTFIGDRRECGLSHKALAIAEIVGDEFPSLHLTTSIFMTG